MLRVFFTKTVVAQHITYKPAVCSADIVEKETTVVVFGSGSDLFLHKQEKYVGQWKVDYKLEKA